MTKQRLLALSNLLSLLVHIGIAYGSNARLFSDATVGEVAEKYDSLFAPAGITFSIWGVIYTTLLAFSIYHLFCAWKKSQEHPANGDTIKIGWWFVMNNLATIAWLLCWTRELIGLSLLLLLVQLFTLVMITTRLGIYDPSREFASKIFTQMPFGIYSGWIIVATISNLASWLGTLEWNWWNVSPVVWTQCMIGLAAFVAIFLMVRKRNVFIGLVVVWAFYGINLKRRMAGGDDDSILIQTAWMGIILVGFMVIVQLITNATRKRERTS